MSLPIKDGTGCIILNRYYSTLLTAAVGELASIQDPDNSRISDQGFTLFLQDNSPSTISIRFAGGPNYLSSTASGSIQYVSIIFPPDNTEKWQVINLPNSNFVKIRNVSYGTDLDAVNLDNVACTNPSDSLNQQWRIVQHDMGSLNPDELLDLGRLNQAILQDDNWVAGVGYWVDQHTDSAPTANNSGGGRGGNLCGDPTCGVDHICAADYNRIVRQMGYPGV